MTQTWRETLNTDTVSPTVVSNAAVSINLNSFNFTPGENYNLGTSLSVYIQSGSVSYTRLTQLGGSLTDINNPITSTWFPGASNATLRFFHNTSGDSANPIYVLTDTLAINWAGGHLNFSYNASTNIFADTLSGPPPTAPPQTFFFQFRLGSIVTNLVIYLTSIKSSSVTNEGMILHSGTATGTFDNVAPVATITSPPANSSSPSSTITIRGTASDNVSICSVAWRWAAPGDDPSPGFSAYGPWNILASSPTPKTLSWSTVADMSTDAESPGSGPGTNWLWVAAQDCLGNYSKIVTRKFFYSVRSPLTLFPTGNGSITGSRGVTNGAMLEIGRGFTVTGNPKDTNTVFLDWLGGNGMHITGQNPYNFLMQSNLTLVANFTGNPFPRIAGNYTGVFFDHTQDPGLDNTGYVNLNLLRNGTYSGTLLIQTHRFPFSGRLEYDGNNWNGNFTITAAKPTIHGSFQFQLGGDGVLTLAPNSTITVDLPRLGPSQTVPLNLTISQYNSNAVPSGPFLLLGPQYIGGVPELDGATYGTATIKTNGQVNLVFHLPDGGTPPVTFSTAVSSNNVVNYFIPLYKGKGFLFGSLDVGALNGYVQTGSIWLKLPDPHAKYYPAGFTAQILFDGTHYSSTAVMSYLQSTGIVGVYLSSRTEPEVKADFFYFTDKNLFVFFPGQAGVTATLTLNPVTGMLAGTFTVAGHKPLSFSGLVAAGGGNGFALGSTNSFGIVVSDDNANSLGAYNDGFVYDDDSGDSFFPHLDATSYWGYQSASQVNPDNSISMHKTLLLPPNFHVQVTDTFPLQINSLPPAPYSGPSTPTPTNPFVSIFPTRAWKLVSK